ncbi:MAG: DUF4197 domain-containing protein [Pseudomonadales bacterium]|nr:DUF4197 domain-containing protein [Pseudomonadales bacterium]
MITTVSSAAGRALFVLALSITTSSGHAAASWLDKLKNALSEKQPAVETLTTGDIANGLKEALKVGTGNVVSQLGQSGGFNLDPEIHIPLPAQLDQIRNLLATVGMDGSLTDLEARLNRAAEIATPKAKALFLNAINDLTLDDVKSIYDGAPDAATQYFREKMSQPLAAEMKPVVDESLADAGAVQVFDTIMARYRDIPFAPAIDANLSDYVIDRGTDGIFHYLAREEAAIRADPAKRTTELLQQVFGR